MTEEQESEMRARIREIRARIQQAADECKRGVITPDELRRRRYEENGRLEQIRWQIVA
jgi:hypothetical protein